MANAGRTKSSGSGPDEPQAAGESAAPVKHVKMKRHHPQFPGGPVEANVHPDEVDNYAKGGWFLPDGPGSGS